MAYAIITTCSSCGSRNGIPAKHLAAVGRCGKCKADLPALAEPLDADPDTFDSIVNSVTVPVLVDFWAGWCQPCRMAAPIVKKVAEQMAGKAVVLKVDTEKHPSLASRFAVQGIPNFLVLKNGKVTMQQAGLVNEREMLRWLHEA